MLSEHAAFHAAKIVGDCISGARGPGVDDFTVLESA